MRDAITNGQIRGVPGGLDIDLVEAEGLRTAIAEVQANLDASFTDLVNRAIHVAQEVCELRRLP